MQETNTIGDNAVLTVHDSNVPHPTAPALGPTLAVGPAVSNKTTPEMQDATPCSRPSTEADTTNRAATTDLPIKSTKGARGMDTGIGTWVNKRPDRNGMDTAIQPAGERAGEGGTNKVGRGLGAVGKRQSAADACACENAMPFGTAATFGTN